ncbi:UDP-glycosyltransferase 89A2-like [Chenopodium quinoa]|nr:UDP-glycosyltransferase 89A2-like [Chenopodium quinoa]
MAKFRTLDIVQMQDIPRSPSLHKEQQPGLYRKYREDDSDWRIVKECFLTNPKSWCYVFNSFYSLEGEYIDQVKKDLGHDRVFSVGPLRSICGPKRVNPDSDAGCGVLKWLDRCPEESVLYVCFGSQKLLSEPQIEALSLGLERSKTRFVWVIKAEGSQVLSKGFEERVSNQGLVIKGWAPQVEILNHKAVGGFLSHCGWNSLLESIIAGVLVLAWPMSADQFHNAKQFVEYAGLAVHLCGGEHTVPDSDELARIISVSINENIPQKENAKVMRQKALEAVKLGGSSSSNVNELVKELSQNIASRT